MAESKTINLLYYARLRELRGLSSEQIETGAHTAEELYRELQAQYKFPFSAENLKVAINEEFQDWDTELSPDDEVVFIPPVAGG